MKPLTPRRRRALQAYILATQKEFTASVTIEKDKKMKFSADDLITLMAALQSGLKDRWDIFYKAMFRITR